jgi:hypothetical protein
MNRAETTQPFIVRAIYPKGTSFGRVNRPYELLHTAKIHLPLEKRVDIVNNPFTGAGNRCAAGRPIKSASQRRR